MRIVPAAAPKSASVKETASSFGVHDTLRYGVRSLAAEVKTSDPFKHRLENVRTFLFDPYISDLEP